MWLKNFSCVGDFSCLKWIVLNVFTDGPLLLPLPLLFFFFGFGVQSDWKLMRIFKLHFWLLGFSFSFFKILQLSVCHETLWLVKLTMYLTSGGRQCNTLWCLLTCAWNCSKTTCYLWLFITLFPAFCGLQSIFGCCTSLLLCVNKGSFFWATLWDVK